MSNHLHYKQTQRRPSRETLARGATAVEYALMLVMILLVVYTAFNQLGYKVGAQTTAARAALESK
jgi:Flp pilus assembly pilin Flp